MKAKQAKLLTERTRLEMMDLITYYEGCLKNSDYRCSLSIILGDKQEPEYRIRLWKDSEIVNEYNGLNAEQIILQMNGFLTAKGIM
jgi:hypothetical protein